jgi:glutaryl-CoA dehydrogenase
LKAFKGLDFYGLDELLTEEERLVRDTVRSFVSERVMPVIEKHAREGTFPRHLTPAMAELGLIGAGISGYGCAGMGPVAYGLILQELERGDSGVRSFISVMGSLVMYPIFQFGSEEHRKKWLPAMAKGEKIGCFGLTEPDFGSNPAGMVTRARKVPGGYSLRGAKMWITNGEIADVAVVWAKDDEGVIRGYLVEKGTKGYSAKPVPHKMSLRASVTSELVLEDAEIPEENLLPGSGGLKSPLMCLNQARYGIAWGAVGAAMACYDEALEYSKTRVQFDRPIGGFQLVQQKLVTMLTEITKAQLLCLRLGRLKETGKATPYQVSLAKRNNVHEALRIARMCRDVLGANGITDEYQVGRHLVNLESVYTYEGTHDIHTLILGQHITELSAFG